jgi:hypothetical protein
MFLLLGSSMGYAQSNLLDKKVSIQADEVPLRKILQELNTKWQVEFSYSDNFVPVNKRITVHYTDTELATVLDDIGVQAGVSYLVVTDKVVLTKAKVTESSFVTISGFAYDAESKERLIGAHIIEGTRNYGVTSNLYGFYSLTLPKGETTVSFTYIGYKPVLALLDLNSDTTIDVGMNSSVLLSELKIQSSDYYDVILDPQMSAIELSYNDVQNNPVGGGETDVFKVIEHIPGVKFGNENTVNMYIRGGDADQNLIMLDGVPLYNTYHLFGFASMMNADAINSVKLIKGGWPARYGGRLSSVLDIRVKEGNMKKLEGEAAVGLLTAQVMLNGPIKKDKTSFLFSARRTYADLLATPLIKAANESSAVVGDWRMSFYDIHGKIKHKLSDKDWLYLSVYSSQDKGLDRRGQEVALPSSNYIWVDEIEVNWQNVTSALRWNHVYNNKLFGNTMLWSSDYQFTLAEDYKYTQQFQQGSSVNFNLFSDYLSGIRDYAGSQQFNWYPNSDHNVRFGGTGTYHEFSPGVYANSSGRTSAAPQNIDSLKIDAREYSLYIEDDAKVSERVRINMGMHMSLFNVRKTNYYSFQPRATVRYLVSERWALKGSYSKMTQYLHLLTTVGYGFPIDLWVPPTDEIGPQEAQQSALGTNFFFGKHWELSLEGYYREMQGLLAFEDEVDFLVPDESWEDKVIVGKGKSRGLEFFLKKNAGRSTGWLSYTLSKTTRSFSEIELGEEFPFKYDRTHDFSVNLVHRFNTRILVNATWIYSTGVPTTKPTGEYPALSTSGNQAVFSSVYIYGLRNGDRLADYHRLDVGVSFVKQKAKVERTLNVSIYNVYNQNNEFYYYLAGNPDGSKEFVPLNLFPIIPSVRFAIKF